MVFRRKDTQSSFKLYKQLKLLSYFALRSTPSGHIVIQMLKSNKLKIFDKKLNLVAELNSGYGEEGDNSAPGQNPHFSNEGQKLVWFSDRYSITVLDLRDMQQEVVEIGLISEELSCNPEPKFCIADFSRGKFLVYSQAGPSFYFSLIDKTNIQKSQSNYDILVYEQAEILINQVLGQKINFMDLSLDKQLIFIGGINRRTNFASISVLDFSRNLDLHSELCLKNLKIQKALCMRLSSQNKEIGMVGCTKTILVIGIDYARKNLDVLKVIEIQLGCIFANMFLFKKCCYIATGNNQGENSILEIKFNEEI